MSPPNHHSLCYLPFRLTLDWKMLWLMWWNHLKSNQLRLRSQLWWNLSGRETKLGCVIIPWATLSSPIDFVFFCWKSKLLEWLWLRDMTDEILCHDRLGNYLGHQQCCECHDKPGVFKCRDCSGGGHLCCQACVVRVHQDLLLHCIKVSSFTTTMEMLKLILIHILAMDWPIFWQGIS